MDSGNTSQVGKVTAVLQALASAQQTSGLTGAEAARIVGRERSQVFRMLKSLEAVGLVERTPETLTYRLGWLLHSLAAHAGDQRLLREGSTILRALVAETGETALLSIPQGTQSFTIARERSLHIIQAGGWIGRSSPLAASASGRAMLYDYDQTAIRDLIERLEAEPHDAPTEILSADELSSRVANERTAGVSVAIDEVELGLTSIAAPIRNGSGRIIASLTISGPSRRMSPRIKAHAAVVADAARRLSRELATDSI